MLSFLKHSFWCWFLLNSSPWQLSCGFDLSKTHSQIINLVLYSFHQCELMLRIYFCCHGRNLLCFPLQPDCFLIVGCGSHHTPKFLIWKKITQNTHDTAENQTKYSVEPSNNRSFAVQLSTVCLHTSSQWPTVTLQRTETSSPISSFPLMSLHFLLLFNIKIIF